ncbi:MAG: hypothetical protein L3K04_01140 [Thermoplasmata archaeon]|nr:hypothetical protein [Thermoplasmata archaeon]MCI4340781.1 hypothetical protein [Thermoplasmata archaeon]
MVSVVGALLALLVFFALFGIFVTQYVPLWMNDNEAQFTGQVQASFAELKQNIDLQTTLGGPQVLSVPFPLASQGIPLFAAPTTATLNYIPHTQGVYASVTMQYGPGGQRNFVYNQSLGTLQVTVPNRYFPPQQFIYEDDAVIQSQGDRQQVIEYPPLISINSSGNYQSVSLTIVQLFGNATQVVSTGTDEVYTHFGSLTSFPSNGSLSAPGAPFTVTIVIGTNQPCAWATFLNATLGEAGLPSGAYTLAPSTCVAGLGASVPVKLVFTELTSFDLFVATSTIVTGIGEI